MLARAVGLLWGGLSSFCLNATVPDAPIIGMVQGLNIVAVDSVNKRAVLRLDGRLLAVTRGETLLGGRVTVNRLLLDGIEIEPSKPNERTEYFRAQFRRAPSGETVATWITDRRPESELIIQSKTYAIPLDAANKK
jgi:hypothetical protein